MDRDTWSVFVGDEYGPGLKVALQLINQIPAKSFIGALNELERTLSIGPMLYPDEYNNGRKFRNAEEYKRVLEALLALRQTLPGTGE